MSEPRQDSELWVRKLRRNLLGKADYERDQAILETARKVPFEARTVPDGLKEAYEQHRKKGYKGPWNPYDHMDPWEKDLIDLQNEKLLRALHRNGGKKARKMKTASKPELNPNIFPSKDVVEERLWLR